MYILRAICARRKSPANGNATLYQNRLYISRNSTHVDATYLVKTQASRMNDTKCVFAFAP